MLLCVVMQQQHMASAWCFRGVLCCRVRGALLAFMAA